jgi:hypothetical protein
MSTFSGHDSGRSLVCLLSCYALWAIDELDEKHATIVSAITPRLRSVRRVCGDWQDMVAAGVVVV